MSLKQKTIVGLFLALMSGIGSVVAATIPGTVDEIDMVLTQNSGIAVTWSAATNAAAYRIYFSRESILGNQGDYDDFVETTGAETTYVFPTYPVLGTKMFAAVLAVTADGTESEGFVSEASIELPAMTSSSSSSVETIPEVVKEPATPTTTGVPLTIEAIVAESLTGVTVRFSKPIVTDLSQNPFVLTETGGELLRIVAAEVLNDQTIRLKTAPQKLMKKYLLGLVANITAIDGTTMTATTPRMPFDAFIPGMIYIKNPVTSSPAPVVNNVPAFSGPTSVTLVGSKQKNGMFTVSVTWSPVLGAMGYTLYTTTDGLSFTKAGSAGPMQSSASFKKVKVANFGVKVTATNSRGVESEGTTKTITLTGTKDTPLANSGLPILGIMLAAGAVTGSRMKWKSK